MGSRVGVCGVEVQPEARCMLGYHGVCRSLWRSLRCLLAGFDLLLGLGRLWQHSSLQLHQERTLESLANGPLQGRERKECVRRGYRTDIYIPAALCHLCL